VEVRSGRMRKNTLFRVFHLFTRNDTKYKLMIPKFNVTPATNLSSYDYIVVEMIAQHIWYSEYSVGNWKNGERYTLQIWENVQDTTKSGVVTVKVADTITELLLKVHLCAREQELNACWKSAMCSTR
jgi:hypothetical protein